MTGKGQQFQLKEAKHRLNLKKKIFYDVGGETLEEVAQKVVDVASLDVFKARFYGALRA